jgi:PAS domain S-box-containing protein
MTDLDLIRMQLIQACGSALLLAFDQLSDLFVFIKDRDRRFVLCSEPFVHLMGYRDARQLIGLRDEDISPEYLVDHYRTHDHRVLTTGEPIVDLIELVRNVDGTYDWFLTTKLPIRSADGAVLGLVGVTRGLTKRNALVDRLLPLTPAVSLISTAYHRQLSVAEMAESVAMSVSHFSRTFKSHFGATPHQYLRQVRLMAACDLLATTDFPLSVVASRTGYYDQSHLSNDFVRERGMTPSAYRTRVRPSGPPTSQHYPKHPP